MASSQPQMLNGTGLFTYIYHKFRPNVGKIIPYIEHLGTGIGWETVVEKRFGG